MTDGRRCEKNETAGANHSEGEKGEHMLDEHPAPHVSTGRINDKKHFLCWGGVERKPRKTGREERYHQPNQKKRGEKMKGCVPTWGKKNANETAPTGTRTN